MDNYITRMEEEYAQLTERVDKLAAFIESNPKFEELPPVEKTLLVAQLNSMSAYGAVLSLRLGIAKAQEEEGAEGSPATPGQDDDLNEPLGERTCTLEEGCESCQ